MQIGYEFVNKKSYNLSPKGRRVKQEVGNRNLQAWKKDNPRGGALKHGINKHGLKNTVKRYSDKRTREGKALTEIINAIVADLGGSAGLNSAQQLILSGIETKLICVLQISKYVDGLPELITKEGRLIPVLANDYLKYQDSVEKSLEILYKRYKPGANVPRIEDLIKGAN